jgi:hypothetical protein
MTGSSSVHDRRGSEVRARHRSIVATAMLALAVVAPPAAAQAVPEPGRHLEVAVGVGLMVGAALGEQAADLRAGGSGAPFRLFAAESVLASSALVDLRVGVPVSGRVTIEGRAAISRPELRTTVSGDLESPSTVTLAERIDQYALDAGVRVALHEWRVAGLVPFATVGAGYLRQLHENETLVEESASYYVGGGVTRWLLTRQAGAVRAAGVRADARLHILSGGDSLGDGRRRQRSLSGSVVVAF